MRLIPLVVFYLLLVNASAQTVNTQGIERNIQGNHVLTINYENDLFTGTDYYHTQGFQIKYTTPFFYKKWFSNTLLLFKGSPQQMGLGFEQNSYTPTDISVSQVLERDRPYAGTMALNLFGSIVNYENKWRASSQFSIGIIGPSAFGKEIQVYIHENTNSTIPRGWHHQVKDDFIFSYQYQFEKNLWNKNEYFNALLDIIITTGTIYNKVCIGGKILFGLFDNPFKEKEKKSKFQILGYTHPYLTIVAYDATLQGGLFDADNTHYIKPTNVSRFVFRNDWGISLIYGRWALEYFQSFMTQEFRWGMTMRNGGIQIGYKL